MAFRFTATWRSSSIALITAFIFALLLSCSYCQRYIEFDITIPSTSWLHLYASVGGVATHSNYKEIKIVATGKPVHVRLPLVPNSFDALIISLDKPGGTVTFSDLKIANRSGNMVSSILTDSIDTSASGTLDTLPGKVLLASTGLSKTLDMRINFTKPLPVIPAGAILYFFETFLLGGVVCFFLLQGLRLLAGLWRIDWDRGGNLLLVAAPLSHQSGQKLYLLTAGLFLVIFGSRLSLISAFGSDLPFWDQWDAEAANLYIPYFNGTLSIGDLFAAHNEHRIFLTRIASLGLLLLNGQWDPLLQMVVNAAIYSAVGVFVFRSMMPSSSRIIWAGFVALVFSLPFGWQNTLGGFQLQFYLMAGLSLLFLWIMTSTELGWQRWSGGGICAVLLLFTMASGFLACVALLLLTMASALKRKSADRCRNLLPVFLLCVSVVVAGMLLKAEVANHANLQADSLGGFTAAFTAFLGWPLSIFPFEIANFSWSPLALFCVAILLWLPSLEFFRIYIKSDCSSRKMDFVAGAAIWVILQAAATAFARGAQLLPASRYQDIFAIGLLINFVLILYALHAETFTKRGWLTRLAVLLWLLGTAGGLVRITWFNAVYALPDRRSQQQASLENVQEYLATGNIKSIEGKPRYDLPYPEYQKLALLLGNKDIRRILPATVTGTAARGRLRPLVNGLLSGSVIIVLSGLACFGLFIRLVICRKTPTGEDMSV